MLSTLLAVILGAGVADDWPQFRGVNAAGVADETRIPVEFGPESNVVRKTAIPMG